jgi:uncharacterized protein (DUF1684 family)
MADNEYSQKLKAWRSAMDVEIRGGTGLLALSGLFWLQKGINTVGSSPDCSICLPKPIPRLLGAFDFDGTRITFSADIGQSVEVDGTPLTPASARPLDDANGAGIVHSGDLAMAIVRHPGSVGVQVWNAARARDFPPRSWFDVSDRYVIRAQYTPYPAPIRIVMPDATGGTQQGYAQGNVSFRLDEKTHRLITTDTEDGGLFIQFRDRTNGIQTHAQGRYLRTGAVSEDGKVILDFNKTYNPPSAFTTFTACTFASKENTLACGIEAGERDANLLKERNVVEVDDLPARNSFDVNERYRVQAEYTAYPAPLKITMPDAAGGSQQGYVQGYVSFKLDGKARRLDATETDDGRLFIQFRDRTNGVLTYPEGRNLHTEAVSEDGHVVIDFNKACNPPSASSAFTTCTFAAKENSLNCAIEAGERYANPPPAQR